MSKGLKELRKQLGRFPKEENFQAEGTAEPEGKWAQDGKGSQYWGGINRHPGKHKLMSPPHMTLGHHKIKHMRDELSEK